MVSLTSVRSVPEQQPEPVARVEVDVADVSVRYGDHDVLRGVMLSVTPGTILSLLGPSGCGKTTLLRTIAGLVQPRAGRIRLGGRTVAGDRVFVPPERRQVGMVFQDWALFPHLSVARNVGFGLSRRARDAGEVDRALALVGLHDCADRMPSTLSGGQQQRVALARALATRPAVLLLDEPFSNLDATLRTELRAEVAQLLREVGTTSIFVTHDQEEAFVLGDEVALMLDGRVQQQAAPADLYEAPASHEVAKFIGDANLLRGHANGASVDTVIGRLPLRVEHQGAVRVLVRPEQLQVTDGDDLDIELVEYYGHDAVYVLRHPHEGRVRARILQRPRHRAGDRVAVTYGGGPTLAYPSEPRRG